MFKDNDFKSHGRKLKLGGEGCRWFLNTLRQDAEFLASINMMDYSLLVGTVPRNVCGRNPHSRMLLDPTPIACVSDVRTLTCKTVHFFTPLKGFERKQTGMKICFNQAEMRMCLVEIVLPR